MSDDLDDLVRRSMKTLDDQTPSGYFDGLPKQVQATLSRPEDSSMQTTTTGSERTLSPVLQQTAPEPAAKDRDEDSGLHDIRSLASSTKLRLSTRRSTQSPVVNEDDVLASSSAGWKHVALPEPAKMVSLPDLATLPTKAEVEALDRAAQKKSKSAKATKAEKLEAASAAAPAIAASTGSAAPMVETPDMPSFGSRITAQKSGGRGKTIAFVMLGLAAAGGGAFYYVTNMSEPKTQLAAYESKPSAPLPTMTAKELPAPTPAAAAPAVVEPPPAPEPEAKPEPKPEPKAEAKAPKEKVHAVEIRSETVNKDPKPTEKPVAPPKEEAKKGSGDEGEPSFDALLKEAGVDGQKKEAKPQLDKKSLSGSDIKAGMGSVAGKATACYAGTQGSAAVKLTVAPSGKVQKVTVSGVFAGTPVAACVESAVKSASFPPWDGGPQTISYSYLLSE